ncbi:MAG: glutathione synthase [Neisseriaceae bacterium]
MHILIIADPLESLITYKDTTYAIMVELASRGLELSHCLSSGLSVRNHGVYAKHTPFQVDTTSTPWFLGGREEVSKVNQFDAILMRSDPPFDLEYLYSTQILTLAEHSGVKVFNSGQAIRDYNEKLAILNFSRWIPPTLVSTRTEDIYYFLKQERDIIVKPLDGMGGREIYHLTQGDHNTQSILESLMKYDTRTIMAQRYLPEVKAGDKRVLLINGEVVPYALARIPKPGELRANLAVGAKAVAKKLTKREKKIAEDLSPQLKEDGIFLAGLDIIGGYLTELNVTSPTCFQEITQQTECNVPKLFVDALLDCL